MYQIRKERLLRVWLLLRGRRERRETGDLWPSPLAEKRVLVLEPEREQKNEAPKP